MDKNMMKNYLYKMDENVIILYGKNHNISINYDEANIILYFLKTHFDDFFNCYDKKEYIYYYFTEPLAYKMYQLYNTLFKKL